VFPKVLANIAFVIYQLLTGRFPGRKIMRIECCLLVVAGVGCFGCGSDEPDSVVPTPESEYLGLKKPTNGFQVRNLGTTVEPGADVEFCEIAELPGDPSETYHVTAAEFGNAPLSHHLAIVAAEPGSPGDNRLREYAVGDSVPCLSAEQAFGSEGMSWVGGTQQPYNIFTYPSGVGREYYGGQRVVFDYHYYNTSAEPIQARSAFNFHVGKAEDVKHIVRRADFTNYTIDTPPKSTGKFIAECKYRQDVMLGELIRHTHRWGTDFSVWFEGGARHGEHIWTSNDWQHDPKFTFSEPLLIRQGEGFRFECNYANTEDYRLRFGTSATDEMCILSALIWNPGPERELPPQMCAVTWVDSAGVGHGASAPGAPKPTQAEADLCIGGATDDACRSCRCNACAHVLIKCATDADCKPMLDCVQTSADCTPVIDAHSSGVGLLFQARACTEISGCNAVCQK